MDRFSVSRGAVRSTINNRTGPQWESQPRSGCKKIYNERDGRIRLRNLRLYPGMKFRDRRTESGLDMSNSTIKRIARKYGLHHWRAKRLPELTKEVAAILLLWSRVRVH